MLQIGCHLSTSKGYYAMVQDADKIGANVLQFFTRNPRGGKAKELDLNDVEKCLSFAKNHGISHFLAHAPYTLNACAKDEGLRKFAKETFADDLRRLAYFPDSMYNFHPGSHVSQGSETGITYIIEALNEVITPEQNTKVLLETMAGKGSEVGRNFQELRQIIEGVKLNQHLGICLDTCHIFDGGYDIVNDLEQVLQEFDEVIGLDRLCAIHLNDSMNVCGSHKDRHAKIGEGNIGLEALCKVINHPKLKHLPFYLETPNELEGYQQEIALLRDHYID